MFDHSKHAAVGVAVLSGVTASVGAASAHATTRDASAATPRGPICATRALPPEAMSRGERSPVFCAGTAADAVALADGEAPGLLSTQAAYVTLAIHYNDAAGNGGQYWVQGQDCSWGVRGVPDWLANDLSATRLVSCSSTKMYTGYDFSGSSTGFNGRPGDFFSLQWPFNDNIRSIKYGA